MTIRWTIRAWRPPATGGTATSGTATSAGASIVRCAVQPHPPALNILNAPSQLVLQPDISRALRRREKPRQFPLFALHQLESAPLEFWQLLEQFSDLGLVHPVARLQLLPHRKSRRHLLIP